MEVQELKEKTSQLFPLFALMRKSVLPLHADIPEALKTMNEHLGNLKDNVDSLTTEEHGVYEAATQAVLSALKSLEDRLWRAQKEFKTPLAGAQAAMTQACQEARALQVELQRFPPRMHPGCHLHLCLTNLPGSDLYRASNVPMHHPCCKISSCRMLKWLLRGLCHLDT